MNERTNGERSRTVKVRDPWWLSPFEVGAPTETQLRRIVRCSWWVVWDELGWAYRGELSRRDGVWWARLEFGHEDSDDDRQVVELRLGERRASRPILDELAGNLGVIVLARYHAAREIESTPDEPIDPPTRLRVVSW